MNITMRTVTPDLAELWLTYNTRNRPVRGRVVSQYARAMAAGEWGRDIDPIAFAGRLDRKRPKPVLLNGQHRLQAIVASGASIDLLVVEEMNDDDQTEMDTGLRRQLADQLKLRGYVCPTDLAAILRLVFNYEYGMLRNKGGAPFSTMIRYLDKHPDIGETVHPARRLYHIIGGRLSVYGAAYFVISQLDDPAVPEDLEEFWRLLVTGEGIVGDPTLALRNAVLAGSTRGGRKHADQPHMLALFFKAWNYYRDGTSVQMLGWRGGGKKPEPFPVPR